MLLEAWPSGRAVLAGLLAVVLVGWTAVGYRWALVRGRRAAVAYVAAALLLGYGVFGLAGPGVGSTLLLVVVVARAVMLLPLSWAAVVVVLVPLAHLGMPMPAGLREMVSTLVACAFAYVLAALHLSEQRARSELATANARLRDLSAQTEELAMMRERTRVARDLHDGLGHHLTVVGMQVQAARTVMPTNPAHADRLLEKAEDQARQALAALREPRSAQPLPQELRALVAESTAAGLPSSLDVDGPERPIDLDVQLTLYHVAQEGLTNVRKHASANSAALRLAYAPDRVRLEVRDDGQGLA